MSQAGMTRLGQYKPQSNVYTVLVIIAALALLAAIGYVWYRSSVVFGTNHPFEILSAAMVNLTGLVNLTGWLPAS